MLFQFENLFHWTNCTGPGYISPYQVTLPLSKPSSNIRKKVERTKVMLKLELSKFSESTEFPWPTNLLLVLFTLGTTPNGNRKLTPYEIFTGILLSLLVRPHIDTSLIYPEMTQYCKISNVFHHHVFATGRRSLSKLRFHSLSSLKSELKLEETEK